MRPPSSRFFLDTVVVHPPPSGLGLDADGAPISADASYGSPIACSGQEVQKGAGTSYADAPAPSGVTEYEFLFAADPGVTEATQAFDWTAHNGTDFTTPITLIATGPARPPHGLQSRYTVSATATR